MNTVHVWHALPAIRLGARLARIEAQIQLCALPTK